MRARTIVRRLTEVPRAALGPLLGLKLPAGLATADLGALKTLTAYGTRVGEESTFTVFLDGR